MALTGLSGRGVQTSTASCLSPDCPVEVTGLSGGALTQSQRLVQGSWVFIPLPPHLLQVLLLSNVRTLSEARKTLSNHSLCEIEPKCEIFELGEEIVRLCELDRAT